MLTWAFGLGEIKVYIYLTWAKAQVNIHYMSPYTTCIYITFSTIIKPIFAKLYIKHPLVKGLKISSSEEPYPSRRVTIVNF